MTSPQSQHARLASLVSDFAERVPGVAHAAVISVHGLLLTASGELSDDRAERLAAVASGLGSLTRGAASCFEAGNVLQTMVEMEGATMLLMSTRQGSCLAVLAAPHCDAGNVAREMSVLADQVGPMLGTDLPQSAAVAEAAAALTLSQPFTPRVPPETLS